MEADPIAIAVTLNKSKTGTGVWIATPIKRALFDQHGLFFTGQGTTPSAALSALATIYKTKLDRQVLPILVEGKQ